MPTSGFYIPYVIEKTGRGERAYDIYSRLLEDRIVFIGDAISDPLANAVIAQLLFLQKENKTQDINLYVNSPGGSVSAGLAIYDTMQFVQPDVATYCIGQAASIAALLLCAGTHGKRYTLPNSRVLLHEPAMSGLSGQATDIDIHAREILRMRANINQLLAKHSGQPMERIQKDVNRDFIMDAEEAKAYGLVDEIIHEKRR